MSPDWWGVCNRICLLSVLPRQRHGPGVAAAALDRELADELIAPLQAVNGDFPFDFLDTAARLIRPGYDTAYPVAQHEARMTVKDALNTLAAQYRDQS